MQSQTLQGLFQQLIISSQPSGSVQWLSKNFFTIDYITRHRYLLTALYLQNAFAKNIVDIPVKGALVGGVTYSSPESSIFEELQSESQFKILERLIQQAVERLLITSRIYGGAVLILDENTSRKGKIETQQEFNKRMATPFQPAYGVVPYFHIIDPWNASSLLFDEQRVLNNAFEVEPSEVLKTTADINNQATNVVLTYNGVQTTIPYIHPSRIYLKREGFLLSHEQVFFRGWGMSAFETTKPQLVNLIKGISAVQKGLDANGILIFKTENIRDQDNIDQVTQGMEDKLKNNGFATLNTTDDLKGIEVAQRIQEPASFLMAMLSSASRIPMSILYGLQAVGFANDQVSLEVYYNFLNEIREDMKLVFDFLIQKTIPSVIEGTEPASMDITIEFTKNLIVQSLGEKEQSINNQILTLERLQEKGLISREEFLQYINQLNAFAFELQI